jgi:hypothetical protein
MEKKTKIILGLAAAGVVAYLVLKPKAQVSPSPTPNPNPSPNPKPSPTPKKEKTNADVLFPSKGNFSWKEYFFGIKPIWSRSIW